MKSQGCVQGCFVGCRPPMPHREDECGAAKVDGEGPPDGGVALEHQVAAVVRVHDRVRPRREPAVVPLVVTELACSLRRFNAQGD